LFFGEQVWREYCHQKFDIVEIFIKNLNNRVTLQNRPQKYLRGQLMMVTKEIIE